MTIAMTTLENTFGDLLVQLRKRAGMTQAELAAVVAYSRSHISALEQNRRQPEMAMVINLLLPALGLQTEPQLATRLVALAADARGERPPPLPASALPTALSTAPDSTSRATTSTLPIPPTPLLGRDQDLIAIANRFSGHSGRLMSLVGPPGVGKSRLALAVASRLQPMFSDGVYFVPLAAVTAAEQLPRALLQALEKTENSNETPKVQLIRFLRHKRLLMVLDNFEQIVTAAALVAELLAVCPGLHLLVTSRERLHLRAEQRYRVVPLALGAAIELFVQRAQAVDADFGLTLANQFSIAEICRRMDCLPLAIELVAAHIELFTPQLLLERLHDQRLTLLTDGARDLPSQQRTLHSAIQSSYTLLSAEEQRCFRTLGVFVGSFDAQAVQALGFDEILIHTLVNKNLVSVMTFQSDQRRFLLLDTIRHFCLENLEQLSELSPIQAAYCEYFVTFAEQTAKKLQEPDYAQWVERFAIEQDNLRSVLNHLLTQQQTAAALRLGCALWLFWDIHSALSEGRLWLTALLQLPDSANYPEQLAQIYLGAGVLAEQLSEYDEAIQYLNAAIMQAQKLGDQRLMITAHNQLGQAYRSQGDYPQSLPHHEQAVQFARATGDKIVIADAVQLLGKIHYYMGDDDRALHFLNEALALVKELNDNYLLCSMLCFLGTFARHRQDYALALQYLNENLERISSIGDPLLLGYTLAELGLVSEAQHDDTTAIQNIQESLKLFTKIDHHWGIARAFEYLAIVADKQHQFTRVCTLAAAAATVRKVSNTVADPDTASKLETILQSVRSSLSAEVAATAWAIGERMSLKEAVEFAQTF